MLRWRTSEGAVRVDRKVAGGGCRTAVFRSAAEYILPRNVWMKPVHSIVEPRRPEPSAG